MRKGMWSAAAFVALVAGAVVLIGVPSLQAADSRVAMGSNNDPLSFLPKDITVPVGTKVVWFNDTDVQHDVSAEDGSFDSKGLLGKGQKYEFTFTKVGGPFKYFCTPHKDAQMKGSVTVAEATAAPTATTAAPTATTTAVQSSTTTTTAKAATGASSSTTATTAAPAGNGATTTTVAPSGAPGSTPEAAGETTTTTAAAHGAGEEAAADHGEGDHKTEKKKNSPIGIAFASVSTLLLAGISGKLLASKS